MIYPYDKGSGFVRIPKEEADLRIKEQLTNTKIISEDPTPTILRKVQRTLCELKKQNRFTEKTYKSIYPSDAIPPRMYRAVKAHKPQKNYPMRLIVSTVGTLTYGISKHLVNIIQPMLNKNASRLKNSLSFVQEAKTWSIEPDEVQVSFDVVNLYPSVPVKEATTVILDQLSKDNELSNRTKLNIKDIKTLIDLCLQRCYFLWENEIYELENSGPIGLALMVVISESFLQHLESNSFQKLLSKQTI